MHESHTLIIREDEGEDEDEEDIKNTEEFWTNSSVESNRILGDSYWFPKERLVLKI